MIGAMAEQRSGSPEVTDQGSSTSGQRRTTTVLALVLAVVFAAAVLGGAKILVDRNVYTPVSMGPVDAPEAESETCAAVVAALPDRTGDYRSVDLTDPAPAGAAAYRSSGGDELTVRCGVSVPTQFTEISELVSHGGTDWLRIDDATRGSDLSTWYSLGGSPVVAVTGSTGPDTPLDKVIDMDGIGSAVSSHTDGPAPVAGDVPLTGLSSGDAGGAGDAACAAFAGELPETLGEYGRITSTTVDGEGTTAGTALDSLAGSGSLAVWTAPGREPVVVRCGVALPGSYRAGAQLTQVDEVPWFEDTELGNGSTAGVWYALGYAGTVAVSLPLDAGDVVLPVLSGVIAGSMEKTGS